MLELRQPRSADSECLPSHLRLPRIAVLESGAYSLDQRSGDALVNYCGLNKNDIANGDGVRVSLFVSGCGNHCKGCHNPEAWDFSYGRPFTKETEDEIIEALRPSWIQGISILGGEPCEEENERVLIPFLKRIKQECPNSDTWLFSGYTYEMMQGSEILQYVDVLVDGPFLLEEKDISLQFRGSRNQRILKLKGGKPI